MVDTPDRVIVLKIVSENGPFAEVVEAIAKTKAEMEKVNTAADKMQKKFDAAKKGVDNIKHSFDNVFSIISKVSGVFASGFSVAESANEVISYAKQLTSLSSQFSKYGVGITDLEKRIVSFGKEISLTRAETMKLFSMFEKKLPFTSLSAAEGILKKIQNVVGSNEEAINGMAAGVLDLVNMYPSLQKAAERLTEEDKKRLQNTVNMAQATGQLTREQAKGLADYISQNKQVGAEDEKTAELRKKQIETQQKVHKLYEDLAITIGDKIYPMLKGAFDFVDAHKDTIMKIGEIFGKWVIPLTIAKSLVGGIFHTAVGGAKVLPEMAKGILGGKKSGGLSWMVHGAAATEAINTKVSKNMLTGSGARVFVTNFPLSMMGSKAEIARQGGLASSSGALGIEEASKTKRDWTKGTGGKTFGEAGVVGAAASGVTGHFVGKAVASEVIQSFDGLKNSSNETKVAVETAGGAVGTFGSVLLSTGNPLLALGAAAASAAAALLSLPIIDTINIRNQTKQMERESNARTTSTIDNLAKTGVISPERKALEEKKLAALTNHERARAAHYEANEFAEESRGQLGGGVVGDAFGKEAKARAALKKAEEELNNVNKEIRELRDGEISHIGSKYVRGGKSALGAMWSGDGRKEEQKKSEEDKAKANKSEEISLQMILLKATQEQKSSELSFLDAQINKLSTIGGSYAEQASVLDKIEAATSTINTENEVMSKLRENALQTINSEKEKSDEIAKRGAENKKSIKDKTKELQNQHALIIGMANKQVSAPDEKKAEIGEKIRDEIGKEKALKEEINKLEEGGKIILKDQYALQVEIATAKGKVAQADTTILQNQQKIREFLNEQLKITEAIVEKSKGLTDASFGQLQAEIALYKGRGDMEGLDKRLKVLGEDARKHLQEQIKNQGILTEEYDATIMKVKALDEALKGGTKEQKDEAMKGLVEKYTKNLTDKGMDKGEAKILAQKKAEAGISQQLNEIDIKRKNTAADMANSALKVGDLAVARIEQESENLKIAEQQANILGQQVSLMDNYAVGIKASAAARMQELDAVRKQVGYKDKMIAQSRVELANAENDAARTRVTQELNKHISERISLMQKEAEIGKSMRDAWIGAIGAMTVGTGRITKITMDQSKNTGLIAENISGAVRSYKGGAVGRAGERVGHNVSSRATGEFGQFTGLAGQGFEPYEVYGGMHYANLQNAMKGNAQGFYGEWAQKNKLATSGGMAGQAAGGHPTYMGALINGQRKTGGVSTFGYGGSPGTTINEAMNGSRGGSPGATPTNEPVKIDVNITSQLGKEFETIVAPAIRTLLERYVGPLGEGVMSGN